MGRPKKCVNALQGAYTKEAIKQRVEMEKAITGEMIKEICLPLKVDRLGHIIKVGV